MPTHLTKLAISTILAIGCAGTAFAQSIAGDSFYRDKARGWFWYEEPEPEPEEPEEPEPEPPVPVPAEPAKVDEPVKDEGPAPGSVAWIRDNLPRLRDRAIESPTDENIQAYYYAQRLMLDMGERFARRANEVVGSDPFLDEDLRSPASNASAEAIAKNAVETRDMLLRRTSEQAALLFFFRGNDCRMCGPTVTALRSLEHRYGFTIMPISLDGFPLAGNPFGQIQYDTGLAEHLGVLMTPAIALAVPPKGAEVVSYSAVSMEAAATRILKAAERQSLISAQEIQATERLNTIGLIDNARLQDAPTDIAENPAEFITRMREEAQRAFNGSGVAP